MNVNCICILLLLAVLSDSVTGGSESMNEGDDTDLTMGTDNVSSSSAVSNTVSVTDIESVGSIDVNDDADADGSLLVMQQSENDDGLIQINPDYVEPPLDDNDVTVNDDDDEATSDVSKEDTKSIIQQSLGGLQKHRTFMKRHRVKIVIALGIIAFRKEIRNLLWNTISKPVYDPETGIIVGRKVQSIHPTAILKILLFIQAVRHLLRMGEGESSSDRNAVAPILYLLSGQFASLAAWLMSDILSPSNPAYLPPSQQHYTFERINHRYQKDVQAYTKAIVEEKVTPLKIRQLLAANRQIPNVSNKERAHMMYETLFQKGETATRMTNAVLSPAITSYNSTIVIMDWTELDSGLSKLDALRDEVSFLIHCQDGFSNAGSEPSNMFEVVVLLESPGGSASEYALAAQQILRLRQNGIAVTICVDKVAASGGYMIACTSTPGRLFAAPFAILGSIGVIGQSVNIHKLLEGWGVTPLVFRGGKDKAPVGLIGEVTKAGMNKVQIMVDDTHRAFKRHVAESRPIIAEQIDEIATGDVWLGYDALRNGLIDRIVTSDEYIGECIQNGARVLKLLKIVRGRSIFSKPQTELLSHWNAGAHQQPRVVQDFVTAFYKLLDKTQRALGILFSDNLSAATRST
jgi:signal peptide peptidase SppA